MVIVSTLCRRSLGRSFRAGLAQAVWKPAAAVRGHVRSCYDLERSERSIAFGRDYWRLALSEHRAQSTYPISVSVDDEQLLTESTDSHSSHVSE